MLAIDAHGYPNCPISGSALYPLLSRYYSADAILHFNAPGTQLPRSSEYEAIRNASVPHSSKCTRENLCLAVNCPLRFHSNYYMNCTFIHQLKLFPAPIHECPLNKPEPEKGRKIFFIFASEGLISSVSVNGRMLRFPSVPLQIITDNAECQRIHDQEFCSNDPKICQTASFYTTFPECCVYSEELLVLESTNHLVFVNALHDTCNHPIHFHGHNFFVMDMGFSEYNPTTGFRGCYSPDIDFYVPEGVDRCKYGILPTKVFRTLVIIPNGRTNINLHMEILHQRLTHIQFAKILLLSRQEGMSLFNFLPTILGTGSCTAIFNYT